MDLTSYLTKEFVISFLSWDNLMTFVTFANALGIVGAMFYVASVSMKTIIPLRMAAIASSFFFLGYGILSRNLPTVVLYATLLPLNTLRLYQIRELIKKVRRAATSDLSMDWLEPFMSKRGFRKGAVLFRKGDAADEMFLAVDGKYLVKELDIEIIPGDIFGEIGLLSPDHRRTQSVVCTQGGHVLAVTYDKVRELYFENPEFGFHFLRLTSQRLLQNVARLEGQLTARRQEAPQGA